MVRWLMEKAANAANAANMENANRREPVVAVTHKGVLRAVLAAATGWDMTVKPPVRLRAGALHWFEVDATGRIALLECNVPLGRMASGPLAGSASAAQP
jgi:broad specificity phosphatase PhoE